LTNTSGTPVVVDILNTDPDVLNARLLGLGEFVAAQYAVKMFPWSSIAMGKIEPSVSSSQSGLLYRKVLGGAALFGSHTDPSPTGCEFSSRSMMLNTLPPIAPPKRSA
jgi:hypothetical protein